MKIQIIGKNIEVTEGISNAIHNSLEVLERYFNNKELEAKVIVRTYPIGQKVEVNLFIDAGHSIRQEVTHEDLYAAIDMTGKKLERQIRRFKDRIAMDKKKSDSLNKLLVLEQFNEPKEVRKVTRRKQLENKPMTESEALLQFELSGHDFYVFDDFENDIVKILYKRKDKNYGIIELD